ncbi:hypothetical protein [Arthrobacter sp. NPDC092385]|uniref:hypothetical protein n=1 Tax=Arthrobacter sp. NPDC092385 TaxID=3363943 RepID=UPI0038246A93
MAVAEGAVLGAADGAGPAAEEVAVAVGGAAGDPSEAVLFPHPVSIKAATAAETRKLLRRSLGELIMV